MTQSINQTSQAINESIHTPPIKVAERDFTRPELEAFAKSVNQSVTQPRVKLPILSIGCGNIVQVSHYPAYKTAGFEVIGVCDLNVDTAKSLAQEWNIKNVYPTISSMVDANRTTKCIYDIAVPASAILSVLIQLPNDAYALIQKPLGENMEQARAIVDLCKEKNIRAAVNFQLRTAPYIIAMKELVASGAIGDITAIEFYVNVHTPWTTWSFLEKASRMEIIYHSIHYIDCMRSLYGDPTRVQAMTWKHVDMPKLASCRSDLLFIYSPWVQTTIHTSHNHKWDKKHAQSFVKIEGTKGFVKAQMGGNIEYPRSDLDYLHLATDATKGDTIDIPLQGSWFPDAFQGPMADVMRFAAGEIDRMPTGVEDAIKTMALCEAAYVSAENSTPIKY